MVKGKKMKSILACIYKIVLMVLLGSFILLPLGCSISQPGETAAEGHRRHIRNARINNQEMMQDLDTVFLIDSPSRLTETRIP